MPQQQEAVSAPRAVWKAAGWGVLLGAVLAVGAEAARVLVGRNLHVVLPGQVYRSAQLSGPRLEQVIERHGIRTVLNVRGFADPMPWYLEESRTTERLDVAQEDIFLSVLRLPSATELRRLVSVLDRCEYPILIHCRRGADRTGLVATLVLLLHSDATLPRARRHLGPRFGHVALGKPACLDHFFELYEDWLQGEQIEHSPAAVRRWLLSDYRPDACCCRIEPLEVPSTVARGRPTALRARFHNTSLRTWRLRPGRNAGIHAGFILANSFGQPLEAGRAGLFDAEVAPGENIDLTLVLPAVHKPGKYRVTVDMVDEQQGWFYQMGSEPLLLELRVQ